MTELVQQTNKYQNRLEQSMKLAGYDELDDSTKGVIAALAYDKELDIVNNMTGLTKSTWDMMKLQKELGRTKETSVQTAEANYYSVLAQATELKRQIREVENSMSLLLGEPAQTIVRGKLEEQTGEVRFIIETDGID